MKKTIKEWLESLPEESRGLAFANAEEGPLQEKVESLRRALRAAFIWRHSEEGYEYWNDVCNKLSYAESPSTESITAPAEDHPLCKINYSASSDVRVEVSESELRDRFAMAALPALIQKSATPCNQAEKKLIAARAYGYAKAMLEARKEYVKE